MRHQFALLMELQQLDDRIQALTREQLHLPQQTQLYEQACHTARQALADFQATIGHSERQQRTLERDLEQAQDALRKTQAKLRDIKTNKEYSAILLEVATGQEHLAALEDQILQLMESIDQQWREQPQMQQRLHTAEQELEQCRRTVQQTADDLAMAIAVQRAARQQTVAQIEPQIVDTYEKLAAQTLCPVVTYLQGGVCSGCYLKVQPQLVSNIRAQTTLYHCPHCRRMLLWPPQ